MNSFLNNPIVDNLGFATVISSVTMTALEFATIFSINDTIQGVVSLGGIIFLYYKIKNIRIEYKIKKREYQNSIERDKKNGNV
tara:strand:- start:926 stop:1174 length:249 start_codon:yes stop_codon:yes gene_type:complete